MIHDEMNLLPSEIKEGYLAIKQLMESRDEWRYRFTPNDEFQKMGDLTKQAEIYWQEMLCRSHIASMLSLFKAARWLEAIVNNRDNHYGLCSSLRGLIESCADSFYTLRNVPLSMARDFRIIKEIVKNEPRVLITNEPLEKTLLHFIQATKLDKDQKRLYPEEYNAKQIREYIESIDDSKNGVMKLYGYLCGVSHPAYEATKTFLFLHQGDTILCSDSKALETQQNRGLIESNDDVIRNLFRAFMVNIYCTLNVLNKFQIDTIYTPINSDEIERHPSWIEVQRLIDLSGVKYSEALQSGVYDL